MEKVTIVAVALAILLVAGAVFVAADFLDAPPASDADDAPVQAPRACGAEGGCGCGGQCGGTCGVAGCGCGR
ncbi:hypothetical protein KY359_02665 [Candidatus Woesearchaeota archaeon]|nr:hypothetical protein [Candidatus Woesearchaeota archaeon]